MNKSVYPYALTTLRILIAPMLLWICREGRAGEWFLPLLTIAFLSDVLDGVIARHFRISTARIRTADSIADILLYLCLMGSIWLTHRVTAGRLIPWFRIVCFVQMVNWLVCWVKFGRLTSYHSYLAKLRGIILFSATVALFGPGHRSEGLWLSCGAALLSNMEGIVLTLVLRRWSFDVWHIGRAIALRRGRAACPT